MKPGYSNSILALLFLAAFLIWPVSDNAQQHSSGPKPGKGKVRWSVCLSPDNPKEIEVTIDRTRVSSHSLVEEIHFDVKFFDSKGSFLRKESFNFTDDTLPYLRSGKHRRWFTHSSRAAVRAEGIELFYTITPIGTNPTNPHRFVESETDPELEDQKDGVQEHNKNISRRGGNVECDDW